MPLNHFQAGGIYRLMSGGVVRSVSDTSHEWLGCQGGIGYLPSRAVSNIAVTPMPVPM